MELGGGSMKANNMKNNKFRASFSGRNFKSGVYVSIISAVVIALVLLINLIITEFDFKIDLSREGIYTITDETKEYVSKMEDDVTIYYLIEAGQESPMFQKIAEKFDALSDRITMEQKDPIQYPTFASEYVDDEISINSFLVVNNNTKQARYVSYNQMLVQEFSEQTYQYHTVGIDVEGKLISAIQYVTNPDLPTVYYTLGHEEYELGQIFKDIMSRMNIAINPLQTLTLERIPEDSDILIINAPTVDFSDAETEMIKNYMSEGGNAVIVMNYEAQELKNLNSLVNYYGIQIEKGIVSEGDANHYVPLYPRYIVPKVLENNLTVGLSSSNRIVVTPTASGITLMDNLRSSLLVEPLLQTSDLAYSKVNLSSDTLMKEAGDIEGPFYIGVLSSDTFNGITSSMVVYTSAMIFDDNMLSEFGNFSLLINTIGSLVGQVETVTVRPRYLYPEPLNITQEPLMILATMTIIVLPLLILVTGILIVVRRRRR
jgi:ABC-2 type transport system permease protein